MPEATFEWDENKDAENQSKHHVSFQEAQSAFADPRRVIAETLATATPRNGFTVSVRRAVAC